MPSNTVTPTVSVTDRGQIAAGKPRVTYRQGFAGLLDFASPPRRIAILPPDAPTSMGLIRTGQSLRDAMAAFRKPKP
jgi:hypothetical protein